MCIRDSSSGTASPARVVVIGPEGDLSGISERSWLFETLADRLRRDHGMDEIRLMPAGRELEATVREVVARRLSGSTLRGQGVDAAFVLDPETDVASLAARDLERGAWFPLGLLEEDSWEVRRMPIRHVVPVPPGGRVLLLRDPTATVEISSEEIDLWRTLGVDLVEPNAEDAAELAVLLAGGRTGPEVQARVRAAMAEYEATEFRRVREAPTLAPKPISTAITGPGAGREAVIEVPLVGGRDCSVVASPMDTPRNGALADGILVG